MFFKQKAEKVEVIAIKDYLKFLGLRVKDKVTGFEGIVVTISFDLYGCIQAIIHPGLVEGKIGELTWFDVGRLEVLDHNPVMETQFKIKQKPSSNYYEKGPENKPSYPAK
jgi:hypothetical protein